MGCVGDCALWSWHLRITETCERWEDSFWKCQFLFLYLSAQANPSLPPSTMLCHSFMSFACCKLCIQMCGTELSEDRFCFFFFRLFHFCYSNSPFSSLWSCYMSEDPFCLWSVSQNDLRRLLLILCRYIITGFSRYTRNCKWYIASIYGNTYQWAPSCFP